MKKGIPISLFGSLDSVGVVIKIKGDIIIPYWYDGKREVMTDYELNFNNEKLDNG